MALPSTREALLSAVARAVGARRSRAARTTAQLVARIDSHLRSRDGWMAENKRSNDLLGQVDTRDRVKSWGRGKGKASDVERGRSGR